MILLIVRLFYLESRYFSSVPNSFEIKFIIVENVFVQNRIANNVIFKMKLTIFFISLLYLYHLLFQ